jgi:hypothetical protein
MPFFASNVLHIFEIIACLSAVAQRVLPRHSPRINAYFSRFV